MELHLEIKIVEREPIKILSTRQMAASSGFEARYVKLFREAFVKKLQVVGAPIAIYHNVNYDGQTDDLEVALPVNQDADGVKELMGGTYAHTMHSGAYGTLPITYTLVGIWVAQNGYEICGAPYDVYVRGGNDKILSPDQYRTEIFVPVRKKAAQEQADPAMQFDFGDDFGKNADDILGLPTDANADDILGPPPGAEAADIPAAPPAAPAPAEEEQLSPEIDGDELLGIDPNLSADDILGPPPSN